MGVFKNEVGRPSNEVIKKRRILKSIIALLVIVVCLLLAYIVNDKLNTKQSSSNENNNEISVYEKYKDLALVRNKTVSVCHSYYFVENGILYVNSDEENFSVQRKQLGTNIKYITSYGSFDTYDGHSSYNIAAFSDDNRLFILNSKGELQQVETDKNIKDLFVNYNDFEGFLFDEELGDSSLYVLTEDNKLLRVGINRDLNGYNISLKEPYEERKICYSPHEGPAEGVCLGKKDNSVLFYEGLDEKNESVVYNEKKVEAKYVFQISNYESDDANTYIITSNNEILIKNYRDDSDNIKLYKDNNVKEVTKGNDSIEIKYDDETAETLKGNIGLYYEFN